MSIATSHFTHVRRRLTLSIFGISLLTAIAVWPDREHRVSAQAPPPARPPSVVDPTLIVRTEASGLITPVSIAGALNSTRSNS